MQHSLQVFFFYKNTTVSVAKWVDTDSLIWTNFLSAVWTIISQFVTDTQN